MEKQTMKLIVEYTEPNVQVLEEESGQKKYYIEGVFLQSEIKNKNKRVYPRSVMQKEATRYINEFVSQGRALGELSHPSNPQINLDKVSHKIVSLNEDDTNYIGKAQLLDTPNGKIAQNFIDNEVKIGVSSRALGSLKQEKDRNVVQDDFHLITAADIVHDPSAPDAFVDGIMEGVEWIYESGQLKKVDLSQDIEQTQKRIDKAHKQYRFDRKSLEEAKIKAFDEFINKLLNN